jgi:hypothetical protein
MRDPIRQPVGGRFRHGARIGGNDDLAVPI